MKGEPPRKILERSFEFATRIVQLCGKLDERVIGAIIVSAKRNVGSD